ncbi:hypothetical protein [Streptomyces uncialis]|uniref:hypothetical protein n=1 Tax=Streptomyces uncialis TaxID=1048205 RepID=UPI00224F137A|nr:hypothetical protein [Streptomyces uncialis]MCX4657995.1 hypothetical protein [Streptomyces uncialis]
MATGRSPNAALRSLLTESGWSGADLARAVNTVGRETGLDLRYDRPSVAQWLAGGVPRGTGPQLVAEALSRRLGRPLTAAQAGFTGAGTPDPEERPRTADTLRTLAGQGDRRTLVYSVSSLTGIPRAAGSGRYQGPKAPPRGSLPMPSAHLRGLRDLTVLFTRTSHVLGAQTVRAPLTAFLATTLCPSFRMRTRPALYQELLASAASLTSLCGTVHVDDELHGTAMEFYRLSAAFADEAGDRHSLASVLRTLSMQAGRLGHHTAALDLALAAVEQGHGTSADTSLLHGQLAAAFAALRDSAAARTSLRTAQELASAAAGTTAPHAHTRVLLAQLAFHRATVAWHLDDRTRAIAALGECARLCPPEMTAPRANALARAAELQAQEGHLDRACDTWSRFLKQSTLTRSRSIDRAVTTMRTTLAPHRDRTSVQSLLRQATLRTTGQPPGCAS